MSNSRLIQFCAFVSGFLLSMSMAWAEVEKPQTEASLRQQIINVLFSRKAMDPNVTEARAKAVTLRNTLQRTTDHYFLTLNYLRLTNTLFEKIPDSLRPLDHFFIYPAEGGSWLNQVAIELGDRGIKFYIRPGLDYEERLGTYDRTNRSIYTIAPPFTGLLSSVLAHELGHYLVLEEIKNLDIPHLELVQIDRENIEFHGYQDFHLSELTASAAGVLDITSAPGSLKKDSEEARFLVVKSDRLLHFASWTRLHIESFLKRLSNGDEDKRFLDLHVPENGRSQIVIQNNIGGKLMFDNFNLNQLDDLAVKRFFKWLSPGWNTWSGMHNLDTYQIMRRLQALRDIMFDLERSLRAFSFLPVAEQHRRGNEPWEYLQKANSEWLKRLNFPKDYVGHSYLENQKDFVLCAQRWDQAMCSPTPPCEDLLR